MDISREQSISLNMVMSELSHYFNKEELQELGPYQAVRLLIKEVHSQATQLGDRLIELEGLRAELAAAKEAAAKCQQEKEAQGILLAEALKKIEAWEAREAQVDTQPAPGGPEKSVQEKREQFLTDLNKQKPSSLADRIAGYFSDAEVTAWANGRNPTITTPKEHAFLSPITTEEAVLLRKAVAALIVAVRRQA